MKEQWTYWEPISGLSKKYHTKLISNSFKKGFVINLVDDNNKKISIRFTGTVISYRITDESYIFDTLTFLENNYGKDFYGDWTFFKIENSEYVEWINKQTYDVYQDIGLKHFCILASDLRLDFITTYEPEVKYILKKNHKSLDFKSE